MSALRRLKEFVDKNTLLSVYNYIVWPYFTYCCEVWDVFGETQSKRLQKLQNRSARIIMNVNNEVDHLVPLSAFGWAYIWNSLPKEIRESKSLSCFESKIATHIIDNSIWNHLFCKRFPLLLLLYLIFAIFYTFVNRFLLLYLLYLIHYYYCTRPSWKSA